jgi:hypothetical protein
VIGAQGALFPTDGSGWVEATRPALAAPVDGNVLHPPIVLVVGCDAVADSPSGGGGGASGVGGGRGRDRGGDGEVYTARGPGAPPVAVDQVAVPTHDPGKPTAVILVGLERANAADVLAPYEVPAATGGRSTSTPSRPSWTSSSCAAAGAKRSAEATGQATGQPADTSSNLEPSIHLTRRRS